MLFERCKTTESGYSIPCKTSPCNKYGRGSHLNTNIKTLLPNTWFWASASNNKGPNTSGHERSPPCKPYIHPPTYLLPRAITPSKDQWKHPYLPQGTSYNELVGDTTLLVPFSRPHGARVTNSSDAVGWMATQASRSALVHPICGGIKGRRTLNCSDKDDVATNLQDIRSHGQGFTSQHPNKAPLGPVFTSQKKSNSIKL